MNLTINQKANQLASQFRQDEGSEYEGGLVIVFKDQVGGWMNELRDPQTWEPGCIAVDLEGNQWVATGGNAYDGANCWQPVPTSIDETLTCPNCKTGFRSDCSVRTNAGQAVCSEQCSDTLNANNDLPFCSDEPVSDEEKNRVLEATVKKIEELFSIDLTPWFDPEEQREHLRTPFNCSGKTVATNGHVLICVEQSDTYETDERLKKLIDLIVNLSATFEPLDYTIPMPELEPCFICNGAGQLTEEKCQECSGQGEVYLHSGYNSYTCECASCEGSGTFQDACDCELCNTTGLAYPDKARVVVAGVPINPKYYQLLINTAENLEVYTDVEARKLFFRNSECQGAIMGMRDPYKI